MKTNFLFSVPTWFSAITLPTYITLLRLVLVPFIVVNLLAHNLPVAFMLFILAAFTDIIDGAVARSLNATSQLGAFLDPVADKILLLSCYACLTYNHFPFNMIPGWFLILVIINELILIAGSFYLGFLKKSVAIKPTQAGKMASFIQVLFIGWLFMCGWARSVPQGPLFLLLMLILCVRMWVLIQYSFIAYYRKPA